ncbi:MAG TPA: ROK family transcriptional regulator [Candidatus Blautia pullistercoris]|uniref:ROK family transcriptional regulator n=1 Tax=Candidatus Blautia pullistercoris TaxID=2838499 RepID=A0A9D1VK38_9FIRM|nr:ROK family transcriptional regulator [Clostridiales bacterium]HIX36491.1 ROK family transcriptional regulator [Candidatus Blautia pullistercoris]
MPIANQEMIRDNNRRLVLEYIVNNPPVSRADLSKHLKLTKATISAIVQDLLLQNLILEIGSAKTSLGRKPILLEFNQQYGYALAIDVRPRQILALISDLKGENCHVHKYPFLPEEQLLPLLTRIVQEMLKEYEQENRKILGISVGIYGVVRKNQILFTPYYPLPDPNLGSMLEETFGIPVLVENEANLSVLGESAFHYDCRNMIHINVHDGIGMGILINGHLYKGKDGYAGEFGHTILFPDGKPCPCGNRGCFELYASEKAILEEYGKRTGKENVSIDEFLSDYSRKIPQAHDIMELFVKYMSIGINNLINTFNTDLIVLNSSFSNYIPDINSRIVEYLARHQNRDCRIIPSSLQDISGLMGGIRLSSEHFLDIRHLKIRTSPLDLEH